MVDYYPIYNSGASAAQLLFDAGIIDAPTVEAMNDYYSEGRDAALAGAAQIQAAIAAVGNITNASGITYQPNAPGATARSVQAKLRDTISILDFPNVDPTGLTDSTAGINAARLAIKNRGGGTLHYPLGTYLGNFTGRSGVINSGEAQGGPYGYLADNKVRRTTFKALNPGWVDSSEAGGAPLSGIIGIDIQGYGVGPANGGIRQQGNSGYIKSCNVSNVGDQAILIDANSYACVVEDGLFFNTFLNNTRTSLVGVVEDRGTDNFFNRLECSWGPGLGGAVFNPSLYICGILLVGANAFVTSCVGEFAERGIHSTSPTNRIVGCRTDRNYGIGGSGTAQWIGHTFLENSLNSPGTYDAFVTGATQSGLMVGCYAMPGASAHKIGFNASEAQYLAKNSKWQFVGCRSIGHTEAEFKQGASQESGWIGGGLVFRDNTATPNVESVGMLIHTASSPTTVTNFVGGTLNQRLHCLPNPNVTIANNANIVTADRCSSAFTNSRGRNFTYSAVQGVGLAWLEDGVTTGVGATANRPTLNLFPGLSYLDTTLNKPIWRNGANTGWIDATGATV